MLLSQNWIGYLDRSYEQVKKSLLSRLGLMAPEISDHTENNVLIIILEMFAGVAEMLNLYIDRMGRETFIGTAQKYSSIIRLAKLMDYNVKAKNPSAADEFFYWTDSSGNPITYNSDYTVPAGTLVQGTNQLNYILTNSIIIPANSKGAFGKVVQQTLVDNVFLGTTTGIPSEQFLLPSDYVNGSLDLSAITGSWKEYTSFGLMFALSEGFVVEIQEDGNAYLVFGDGVNGKIPPNATDLIVAYKLTEGLSGDTSPGTITKLLSDLTVPTNYVLNVNNPDYSNGGEDFETIEEIRNRAPRSIRLNNRTVTYQDYLDDPLLVPGVANAVARYCCGKYIDVYIVPTGRGNANNTLISNVQNYLNRRKMIGTFPLVMAAGVSKIWIQGTVYGKPLVPEIKIQLQIADALDKAYGYNNIKINIKFGISDLIALIENLSLVDRFELAAVRILPYARATDGTVTTLLMTVTTLPHSTVQIPYILIYNGNGQFSIYRNNTLLENTYVTVGQSYQDDNIGFTIVDNNYNVGDRWSFNVFPTYPEIFPTTIIKVNDNSASIVDVADYIDDNTERAIFSDIRIVTQDITVDELPDCD